MLIRCFNSVNVFLYVRVSFRYFAMPHQTCQGITHLQNDIQGCHTSNSKHCLFQKRNCNIPQYPAVPVLYFHTVYYHYRQKETTEKSQICEDVPYSFFLVKVKGKKDMGKFFETACMKCRQYCTKRCKAVPISF